METATPNNEQPTKEKVGEDTLEEPNNDTGSPLKPKKFSKQKIRDFADLSVSLHITLPNDHLPVLGLCAPNAKEAESAQ